MLFHEVLPSDAFDYGESRVDYEWFFFLFSSNKSLADSLDECVDAKDPNFNKVGSTNCLRFFFKLNYLFLFCGSSPSITKSTKDLRID